MKNPYLPLPVRIKEVITATEDNSLKTFRLEFLHSEHAESFQFKPGQFAQISVPGAGEVPIGIASSPHEGPDLLFTISKAGVVTTKLHSMKAGDRLGVRGPLGHPYPLDQATGKNLVILAGGYAVTTLRSTMIWLLHPDNRSNYERITFIYGARTPGMLLYLEDIVQWEKSGQADIHLTVDNEAPGWERLVGFVPQIAQQVAPSPENSMALICGPPVMIKFTQPVLDNLGWKSEQIIMSLENRMKCGIGICGRCNVGPYYVCSDGPVFTKAELDVLPAEY
ncbi:FAD/NAD(P)-binding protein [Desulfonatronovibrio magnus]|uniref:FAD/NAD(P)-binding protein n=1 Tax=Desulfonatronovibrio magnus TaxID=698827 RepID=UPI0005EBEE42|nr:FAD/NAD(P)-binding protein [Desulfonatronovibrio magnus]